MPNSITSGSFRFEASQLHGATLFAVSDKLSTAMKETEIDNHIAKLCAELHGIGAEMKTALRRLDEEPLHFGKPDA